MSPYSFVLLMEVQTQLLNSKAKVGSLGYHPKCKALELTQLSFADDLFIFTNCSMHSYRALCSVLDDFYLLSGLNLKVEKSEFYCAGLTEGHAKNLFEMSGFRRGYLPIRYLGVLLITSRLKAHDCRPLMEKIIERVKPWVANSLSYAGRL